MLELTRVRSGYGRLPVLFDVSLTVAAGEMISIVGSNGAGKSTLLKTILGAITPTAGEIVWNGERITSMPAHKRVAAGISLSPEGRQMFPALTVRENLITGAQGVDNRQAKDQFDRVYDLFPKLLERTDQLAGSLSGGEAQMLAVSRALMSRPKLVLVDELSLGLAPVIAERLYDALRKLCDEGLAVVMVEQFHLMAASHSDRTLVLEKGRFVDQAESDTASSSRSDENAGVGETLITLA